MSTPRTTSRAMSALIGRAADMDVDEPPIVLLERSARAGRGNRYQALLAAELQREQEAAGKALRGDMPADTDDEDDEFAPAADVAEEDLDDEGADYSGDEGERPWEGDDDDDEEAQLQRDERASKRKKDSSLFYLKKRSTTTRKPLRSTFDVDPGPAESTVMDHDPSSPEEGDDEKAAAPVPSQRRSTRRHLMTSSSIPKPSPSDADMLVRRREPRSTNSLYRRIRTPPVSEPSSASHQKIKPKTRTTQPARRMTQEERMAAALEMEEENVDELRTWLADEEKKRADRRPTPKSLRGPKLTTLSIEAGRPVVIVGGGPDDVESGPSRKKQRRQTGASAARSPEQETLLLMDDERSASESVTPVVKTTSRGKGRATASSCSDDESACISDCAVPVDDGGVRSARTYLHLSHPPPARSEMMAVLFGDHVDWGQPSLPPTEAVERELCAVTGLPARYKDPKTGTPFATVAAYEKIQQQRALLAAVATINRVTVGTSGRRPDRSILKLQSPVAPTTAASSASRRSRDVRIAPATEDEIDGGIEPILSEGPPSPAKSVGSAGGRSHRTASSGDELVMEGWGE